MRKPVNTWSVLICFALVAIVISTLFLPIFSIKLTPVSGADEYIGVNGLEMLQSYFGNGSDFASQTTGARKLYEFLGKGTAENLSQYINPIYINVTIITYVATLALSAIMLIITLFNFAGIRLSVFNVFAGLFTMVCGIIMIVCILTQNGEYVVNMAIDYGFRLSIGAILIAVVGFVYMMVAPKKRV